MATKPTHEQAQLHLQVYDLRREPRLRQARDWFQQHYNVQTFDEAMKFMQPNSEGGTFIGMVIGYWEQACALLNYGLLHEGLFFETSGEFYIVWDKLKKVLPEFSEKFGDKHMLENLEKAAERYEAWAERRSPGSIDKMRAMMNQPAQPQTSKAANR